MLTFLPFTIFIFTTLLFLPQAEPYMIYSVAPVTFFHERLTFFLPDLAFNITFANEDPAISPLSAFNFEILLLTSFIPFSSVFKIPLSTDASVVVANSVGISFVVGATVVGTAFVVGTTVVGTAFVVGATVVGTAFVVGATVVGTAFVVGATVVGTAFVVGATVVGTAFVVGATVVGIFVVGATVVGTAFVVGATVVGTAFVVGATVVGTTVVGFSPDQPAKV